MEKLKSLFGIKTGSSWKSRIRGLILIILLTFSLLSFLLVFLINRLKRAAPLPISTKEETPGRKGELPVFDGSIANPSRYATDPEVLRIEKAINDLDRELSEADFKELRLNPPPLYFDVGFERR